MQPSSAAAAAYYRDLAEDLQQYGEQAFGWHYGVWDLPRITTHAQALLRSNEWLVEGLPLTAASHVLDVGCGLGSTAIWTAQKLRCRVTGITICEEHVGRARSIARAHGVDGLCRFELMDMSRLEFADCTFDAVVNQETFCYSVDKRAYLAEVRRVLKPGGEWRAIAFAVQDEPPAEARATDYDAVVDGFKLASMLPAREVESLMKSAGLVRTRAVDITDAVLPTARRILEACRLPLLLMRLRLDWLIFSPQPVRRSHFQGHYRAGQAYSAGLCSGSFRHFFYSGAR